MNFNKHLLGAAAAAALLAAPAANAAHVTFVQGVDGGTYDIGVNYEFSGAGTMLEGGSIRFDFNVIEDIRIREFSFSGTGHSMGADLATVTFGYGSGAMFESTGSYDTIVNIGSVSAATGFLDGREFMMGDTFFVQLNQPGDGNGDGGNLVSGDASFNTAAIPVPAAGGLLLIALAAGGVAARRKKA